MIIQIPPFKGDLELPCMISYSEAAGLILRDPLMRGMTARGPFANQIQLTKTPGLYLVPISIWSWLK